MSHRDVSVAACHSIGNQPYLRYRNPRNAGYVGSSGFALIALVLQLSGERRVSWVSPAVCLRASRAGCV